MDPTIGQPAPAFTLKNQHGQDVSLDSFLGKSLVVVFYPFAFSSVCSGELAEIRDNIADLSNDSSAVVAVSCDSMFALRVFADRDSLSFPLLSDFWPHGAVARAFGVFDERSGCATRSTVILDREGLIRWRVSNEMAQRRDLGVYRAVLAELA